MALVESRFVPFPAPLGVVRGDADDVVIWLRGEHDQSTAEVLHDSFARAMALDDGNLVVDMSHVQFMGTATARVIVDTRQALIGCSRLLTLRSPSKSAQRTIDLCGLA